MNTSVRLPPRQGAPKIFSKVYSYNLRPIVLFVTFLASLYALFGTISYFRAMSIDREENFDKLAMMSIILGSLYAGVLAIELFGFGAALMQRLPLVRAYAFASIGSSLLVVAIGLLRIIVHFTMKNDIINLCTSLNNNRKLSVYPFGFFGPVYHDTLSRTEAESWCNRQWDHDSWADIIGWLLTIVLAVMFTGLSFSYYRQLQDPSSIINKSRAPVNNYNQNNGYYASPYGANVPNLDYGYSGYPQQPQQQQQPYFAPPPGPPPQFRRSEDSQEEDLSKPPGYSNADAAMGSAGGFGYSTEKKDEDPFADRK